MARESTHQKLLLPLVALIIILSTFIIFLSRQNTSLTPPIDDSTPSLKTYINKNYGYRFEYPTNVNIEEETKFTRLSWSFKNSQDFNSGIVEVVPNKGNLDATTYADTKFCEAAQPEYREFCQEKVNNTIGPWGGSNYADEAVSATYNLYENETQAYVYPFKNNFIIFRFSGETGTSVEDLDFDTIQTIINSLDTR